MADFLETYFYTHRFKGRTEVSKAIIVTFGAESCHIKYQAGNKWFDEWVPAHLITSYQAGSYSPLTVHRSEGE